MEPNHVKCDCCELEVHERLASPDRNAHELIRGWRCRICNEHQGNPLKMAQDHEDEVRERWGQTADQLNDALDRADSYREKMLAAFKSRDSVLRQFEKLTRFHRENGHGCICGKRNCELLAIVDADWINGYIDRMHQRDITG